MKYDFETFDPLSDAFNLARLSGRVYCYCEFSAPWALQLPESETAYFHVVERGGGFLKIADESAYPLAAGDLIVIFKGRGHVIYDHAESSPISLAEFLKLGAEKRIIRHGGGGAETNLVCGEFAFDERRGASFLSLLPPVIHLKSSERAHDWLETALRQLAFEAKNSRSGSDAIISRLTEIIFIQAVCAWIEQQPIDRTGWLGALRDEQIGRAVSLIHRQPETAWNLAKLAKESGMSRSKFAARFRQIVGETPGAYLTKWRMQVAARLLADENLTVAETAQRVGYQSETTFSKTFKQQFGAPPSQFRRKSAEK